MTDRFYLDTSVWLDFYLKRGKDGEIAKKLISKIIEKNKIIIYSDNILMEFKRLGLHESEINEILRILKPKNIQRVHITKEQIIKMHKLARQRELPKNDALHSILARDHESQLVSRDKHFEKLKDITIPKRPEELI